MQRTRMWTGTGFAAGLLLAGLALTAPSFGGDGAKNPDDWLLNAPDDAARWALIQKQLRGFSAAMIEVGHRYDALSEAVGDNNSELAAYQLQKIKEVIVNGYTRRPKRQKNADETFVKGVYEPALADIKSGDALKAKAALAQVRKACMSCHDDEDVGFINKQARFRRGEAPE